MERRRHRHEPGHRLPGQRRGRAGRVLGPAGRGLRPHEYVPRQPTLVSSMAGTSGARAKGLSRSELLKRAGVAVTAAAFGGAGIGQQFAKNKDAAEKFLVDLCAGYEGATIASNLFNFPSFPGAFPAKQLYKAAAADTHAPHGKYSILTTVASKYTCN